MKPMSLIEAAKELIENNGGPTSTLDGDDSHVLVRREDFDELCRQVDKLIHPLDRLQS